MPLVKIDLNVAGEKQLSRAFQAEAREAEDMTQPLARFGAFLLREVGEQFLTEGAEGGTPWPRLNRAYEAWKAEHYPGRPMLVRTGALRSAALSPQALTVTPRRLVYEIDDANVGGIDHAHDVGEVAYYHQRGKGHLRQRRIVELNQAARRQLDRAFADWLNGLRRGQGINPR